MYMEKLSPLNKTTLECSMIKGLIFFLILSEFVNILCSVKDQTSWSVVNYETSVTFGLDFFTESGNILHIYIIQNTVHPYKLETY